MFILPLLTAKKENKLHISAIKYYLNIKTQYVLRVNTESFISLQSPLLFDFYEELFLSLEATWASIS